MVRLQYRMHLEKPTWRCLISFLVCVVIVQVVDHRFVEKHSRKRHYVRSLRFEKVCSENRSYVDEARSGNKCIRELNSATVLIP